MLMERSGGCLCNIYLETSGQSGDFWDQDSLGQRNGRRGHCFCCLCRILFEFDWVCRGDFRNRRFSLWRHDGSIRKLSLDTQYWTHPSMSDGDDPFAFSLVGLFHVSFPVLNLSVAPHTTHYCNPGPQPDRISCPRCLCFCALPTLGETPIHRARPFLG
jgi:hypothetical protein